MSGVVSVFSGKMARVRNRLCVIAVVVRTLRPLHRSKGSTDEAHMRKWAM